MQWHLQYGKDLKFALEIQERMDAKGEGEQVRELAAKPKLYYDLNFVFEAFWIIKDFCDDRTIKIGDVLDYCELNYIHDLDDRLQILKYVKAMERQTLEYGKTIKQRSSNIPKRK